MCGIALKINAAINIQNAYLSVDLESAYAPSVPKNKEMLTTKTVTIIVFLDAFQNSPSVQAWVYASVVNFPPVSIKVLKAEIAYHQSDLEKKSALPLNDHQKVQMKGKQAINSHIIIKIVLKVFKLVVFLSKP